MKTTTIALAVLLLSTVLGVIDAPASPVGAAEARPNCPPGTTWVVIACVLDPRRCRMNDDLTFYCH